MDYLAFLAFTVLTIIVGATSDAFAAIAPISLPEPSSLAVLAVGVGAAAIFKAWKRR